MSVDVQRERPTSGRLGAIGGAGPVRPPARVEVVTSAAASGRRTAYPEAHGRPPLTEEELFFAYRRMNERDG